MRRMTAMVLAALFCLFSPHTKYTAYATCADNARYTLTAGEEELLCLALSQAAGDAPFAAQTGIAAVALRRLYEGNGQFGDTMAQVLLGMGLPISARTADTTQIDSCAASCAAIYAAKYGADPTGGAWMFCAPGQPLPPAFGDLLFNCAGFRFGTGDKCCL